MSEGRICVCCNCPDRFPEKHPPGDDCGTQIPPSDFHKKMAANVCYHICQHPEEPIYYTKNMCKCRRPLDKTILYRNSCADVNKDPRSISLDNVMNQFNVTYRRVNQGANLIGYDKYPVSITKTDFIQQDMDYPRMLPSESPSSSVICKEIARVGTLQPQGKRAKIVTHFNPNYLYYKNCTNSSFKRAMTGNELRIPRLKPLSITSTDYVFKPFDPNMFPIEAEIENRSELYQDFPVPHKAMDPLMNAMETRFRTPQQKQEHYVDHWKDINEEKCTFLRVHQQADFNNIDPNPVSIATAAFERKEYGDPCRVHGAKHMRVPPNTTVNMVQFYKNLEASMK